MSARKTTRLQERLIQALARALPEATLTGGSALAAFYLRHRTTRDIDLFFHGKTKLEAPTIAQARDAIHELADRVNVIATAPSFVRLEAVGQGETMLVDLVASPIATVEPPTSLELDGVFIQVDTAREIFVNKLVALLSRSELRDLIDVRAFLAAGLRLEDALEHAPMKDAGFSPLTLAWVLRSLDVRRLAAVSGVDEEEAGALVTFRDSLIAALVAPALKA